VTAFELPRTGGETLCGNGDDIPGSEPMNAMCMTTPVTVATCANQPFSTNCKGSDIFDGARAVRLGVCVENNGKQLGCAENDGFTADEITCIENPFTADAVGGINCGTLLTALGDENTLGTAQDNLITYCTGADVVSSDPRCDLSATDGEVTACLANPFGATCATELGATHAATAQNNIISLCTGADADGMNSRCMTIAATTACLANPFADSCDTDLGSETQATTAQNNLIALCTGTDASVATNTLCTTLPDSATKSCITNPFGNACETTLGATQAETAQNNLIEVCTGADADGSSPRCTIASAALVTECFDNPFAAQCVTVLDSNPLMSLQSNVIALCTGDAITTNALCMDLTGNIKTCLDDPFTPDADNGINCGETLGTMVRDDLQSDIVALCTGDDADDRSNPRCATAATTSDCLTNPFDA
ncbi:MAG: hypothetical protein K8953_06250, partial [Proteobacteria bacterium]|nr:hypothetical protein [Pseudomonadota bacterium]